MMQTRKKRGRREGHVLENELVGLNSYAVPGEEHAVIEEVCYSRACKVASEFKLVEFPLLRKCLRK